MFCALYKNEMIKLFRRKGTIIIICIIALLTLLVAGSSFSGRGYSLNPDDFSAEIMRKNCIRARDAGVTEDDWRYDVYNKIQTGVYQYQGGDHYPEDDYIRSEIGYDSSVIADQQKKEVEALWKYIDDNDSAGYFASIQKRIADMAKKNHDQYIDAFKNFDRKSLTSAEEQVFLQIESEYKKLFSLADGICNFDSASIPGTDAFCKVLSGAEKQLAAVYYRSGFISEKTELGSNYYSGDKYLEYLEDFLEWARKRSEALSIYLYSLEHGVTDTATAGYTSSGSRSALLGVFGFVFSAAAVFGVFLAGASVSSEFSRKTVNMLVIRPVSRTKILLSKLAACLTAVYSALIAGVLAYWLIKGIMMGFSDYLQPYLWYDGTTVKSCSFGIWFIGRCALASLGTVAYTILAFVLSAVTRSTPVSTVLPMLWFALGNIVNYIIYAICGRAEITGIVRYLPSMYSNLWNFATEGLFASNENLDIIGLLNAGFLGADAGLDLLHGAVILPVFTIVIAVIGFVTFAKRDIK